MIMYESTRGSKQHKTAAQAVIQGIAEDRGLYVPDHVPALPMPIEDMAGMSYKEVAFERVLDIIVYLQLAAEQCLSLIALVYRRTQYMHQVGIPQKYLVRLV